MLVCFMHIFLISSLLIHIKFALHATAETLCFTTKLLLNSQICRIILVYWVRNSNDSRRSVLWIFQGLFHSPIVGSVKNSKIREIIYILSLIDQANSSCIKYTIFQQYPDMGKWAKCVPNFLEQRFYWLVPMWFKFGESSFPNSTNHCVYPS